MKKTVRYAVEVRVDENRWMRDFEPVKTLEEARRKVAHMNDDAGKRNIRGCGMITVECGVVAQTECRIVKVTREVIE